MSSDRYAQALRAPLLGQLAGRLGAPRPPVLARHGERSAAEQHGAVVGGAPGGRLEQPLRETLAALAVQTSADGGRAGALLFDASGIAHSQELVELHSFFAPALAALVRNGRVLVLGTPPDQTVSTAAQTAQRALEGFTRSLGKELGRHGATVQLLQIAAGAEHAMSSTLRFLLSPASAYISGQRIVLHKPAVPENPSPAGRTALVTGSARGIGAATASVLAREGLDVVGLDIPGSGQALELDITAPEAPQAILDRFPDGLDVLVHNAGVTVDRTLARMKPERWSKVIEINLSAEERINDALLAAGTLRPGGRIICTSSIAGIAGNAGQTNYATSKAGVIGMVQALAPELAEHHQATINALAPGFIETDMTAAMPFAIREAGRRMNSLLQGGRPVDVAEAVAWLAAPDSGAVNGNTVRVCGQSLLGA
jgi:3-oxoacyl-[acyl-carrier protein] reductase